MGENNRFKERFDDDEWEDELDEINQKFERRAENKSNQRKLNIRRKIEEYQETREQRKRNRFNNDDWDLLP